MLGVGCKNHHRTKGRIICLRFGHKIDWLLVFRQFPVFLVVSIHHQSRAKGQKAGPHMETVGTPHVSKVVVFVWK